MDELVLGANDEPIVPGARVTVRNRPGMGGYGELEGFGGIVTEVNPKCITLTEFGTFHNRSIRPRDVAVESGETRSSLETRAAMDEGKRA